LHRCVVVLLVWARCARRPWPERAGLDALFWPKTAIFKIDKGSRKRAFKDALFWPKRPFSKSTRVQENAHPRPGRGKRKRKKLTIRNFAKRACPYYHYIGA